jgi:hypothetical protein
MKPTATILFLLLSFSGFAQSETSTTITYRIDYFKADSIYLVEVREKVLSPGRRPEITESPIFARDISEIAKLIEDVQKQADAAAAKAKEYSTLASEVNRVYNALQSKLSELKQ